MKKKCSNRLHLRLKVLAKATLLAVLVGVHACHQNDPPSDLLVKPDPQLSQESVSVEEAQALYASYTAKAKAARTTKRIRKEKPMWSEGKNHTLANGKKMLVVQVEEAMDALTLVSFDKDNSTPKRFEDLYTAVKLVFFKDEKGKDQMQRMYIKADKDYSDRKKFRFEDADFSGRIWYEDMDDNFIRAVFYKDGKMVGKETPRDEKKKGGRVTYTCTTIYETTTTTTNYYSIACAGTPPNCGQPSFMYYVTNTTTTVLYESCYADPTDPDYVPAGSGSLSISDPGFWDYFNRINNFERDWLLQNPEKAYQAYTNFKMADVSSRQRFGGSIEKDQDGTNQNAYKHAYAAALHTRSWGPQVALTIMNNHENRNPAPQIGSPDFNNIHILDRMDYINNALGIHAANDCGCDGDALRNYVQNLINTGQGVRAVYGSNIQSTTLLPTTSGNIDND